MIKRHYFMVSTGNLLSDGSLMVVNGTSVSCGWFLDRRALLDEFSATQKKALIDAGCLEETITVMSFSRI